MRQAFNLSVNGGNKVLRRQFDAGLVRRHAATLTGDVSWQSQPVYTLGPAAAEWVQAWEDIPLDEARRHCRGDRTPTYLAHALSVVDIYLSLKAALSGRDDWVLRDFLGEHQCADELTVGMGKSEKRVTIRPDAVALLKRTADGALFCFALESDRHNVRAKAFAHKAENYRLYLESGAFREAYPGTRSLAVLTVTGTDSRVAMLAETVRQAKSDAPFLFATRADIEKHGFLALVWQTASKIPMNRLSPIDQFQTEEGANR